MKYIKRAINRFRKEVHTKVHKVHATITNIHWKSPFTPNFKLTVHLMLSLYM